MLNIDFKRNSEPVDDEDMQAIVSSINLGMSSVSSTDRELALLLSKLVFRIQQLEAQLVAPSRSGKDGLS